MNCISCNIEISPSFIKVIRENICPACGQNHMSTEDHLALMNVVSQLISGGANMTENEAIKTSASLFGKFDIFPKGVVVDGVVEKEVIYITTQPPQYPQYGFAPGMPAMPAWSPVYGPSAGAPPPPPPPAPKTTGPTLATRQRLDDIRKAAEELAHEEDDDVVTSIQFDSDGDITNYTSSDSARDLKEEQAARLAKERANQVRLKKAGIK